MNYIELINHFWKVDIEFSFTGNETKLYMFLVHTSNSLGWKNPFRLSYRQIASNANLAVNTIKSARNRLKQAGLIDFSDGKRGSAADVSNKTRYEISVSKIDYHADGCPDIHPAIHPACQPGTVDKQEGKKKPNNVSPRCPPGQNFCGNGADADQECFTAPGEEKEKSCAKKERGVLVLPYPSEQFAEAWEGLAGSEGWRGKPLPDLQEALDRLGEFEEEYSLLLMKKAAANGWRSVVFEETAGRYRMWKAGRERRGVARRGNFASHDNSKQYEDF